MLRARNKRRLLSRMFGDGIDGEDGQQLMGRQLEDDSVGRWHSDFDCSGWRLDSLAS